MEFAENAYDDIQCGKEAKQIVKDLYKNLSDEPFVFGQTRSKVYQKAVSEIQNLAKSTKKIFDKDYCIYEIVMFKQQLQTITL